TAAIKARIEAARADQDALRAKLEAKRRRLGISVN
ncbi:hypothetical protein KIPB_014214, partial [Kipferlia bialata]